MRKRVRFQFVPDYWESPLPVTSVSLRLSREMEREIELARQMLEGSKHITSVYLEVPRADIIIRAEGDLTEHDMVPYLVLEKDRYLMRLASLRDGYRDIESNDMDYEVRDR